MTLAEQSLAQRAFKTMVAPFAVYCYLCNIIMAAGTLTKRFDAATYTHELCPKRHHKTFAPHKYGANR